MDTRASGATTPGPHHCLAHSSWGEKKILRHRALPAVLRARLVAMGAMTVLPFPSGAGSRRLVATVRRYVLTEITLGAARIVVCPRIGHALQHLAAEIFLI